MKLVLRRGPARVCNARVRQSGRAPAEFRQAFVAMIHVYVRGITPRWRIQCGLQGVRRWITLIIIGSLVYAP
jgi:hypothetical protein